MADGGSIVGYYCTNKKWYLLLSLYYCCCCRCCIVLFMSYPFVRVSLFLYVYVTWCLYLFLFYLLFLKYACMLYGAIVWLLHDRRKEWERHRERESVCIHVNIAKRLLCMEKTVCYSKQKGSITWKGIIKLA